MSVEQETVEFEVGEQRQDYRFFTSIPTRWNDNDMLGHVNNVVYYSYFEAVVIQFLMQETTVDWVKGPVSPLAVETLCRFRRSLSFPMIVDAGLRVDKIGNTSVTYSIGLFPQDEDLISAYGHFVHVYVDRATEKPTPIPDDIRATYERFL